MTDVSYLCTCSSRIEADLLKGLLDQAGIFCLIQADDAGGMRPFMTAASGVGVKVRTPDLALAKEILASLETPAPE